MDSQTFGELVIASAPTLYHIAKAILKNDSDCEDAAQEAITIAFSKLSSLKNDQYAKTWLVRILINECYRILRKKRQFDITGKQPEIEWNDREHSDLYCALHELDAKFRIPIILFYLEGFSVSEISDILNISPGTVKSRLARARNKLKHILNDSEDMNYERI